MAIDYTDDAGQIRADQLQGFFVNWKNPPDPQTHLRILQGSARVWLAIDQDRCVGFINAISDGVFYAFIPLLEVLPSHKGHGVGSELVRRMVETLKEMYAIDVICDEEIMPFYGRLGFTPSHAMIRRDYFRQSGHPQS
ncbi:MAG: GNAT family N-acetyltransferase [candidate division Zixibacteria bacterium]|nr:GNAT family N-acetyltransferase [candidate division Zixibacteria bacterium]